LCDDAQIGTNSQFEPLVFDNKPGGLACIVGNSEGVKGQVPDAEGRTALEDLSVSGPSNSNRELLQGPPAEKDREVESAAQYTGTANMVLMFMADQQCVQLVWPHGTPFHAAHQFFGR
jgi:hypothetical protein